MIDVSVIVPVYNAEKYLRQALDSLICQTEKNIEIICVDDCSSDSSYEILCEYAKADDRVKVAKNEEISDGAALARNKGMKIAKGEYLAFMDADDFADKRMLERAIKKATEVDPDILFFDVWYYDDNVKVDFYKNTFLNPAYIPKSESFSPKDHKNDIFRMTQGAVWGRLFKREFIKNNDLWFYSCYYWDDIVFFYSALCLAKKVIVLNERLLHYRWNAADNQSSHAAEHPEIAYKATLEMRHRFEEKGIYDTYRIPLINHLLSRAFSIFGRIQEVDSFDHLYWALKNEYLEKIGAYDIKDEEYANQHILRLRDLIYQTNSPEEYLLKKQTIYVEKGSNYMADLAMKTNGRAKVVVYGAGRKGKVAFCEIMNNELYSIIKWVDRNYESIGFPVSSPESIEETEFDYIFICVSDEDAIREIHNELTEKGVSEERMIDYFAGR